MQKPGDFDLDIPAYQGGAEPAPPPANDPGPAAAPPADPAGEQLKAATAEVADLKDQLLRARAELENQRRRLEREREEAVKYAATKLARDILSVADNLGRALQAAPRDAADAVKNFVGGIEATERELLTIFERHGIVRISPEGARFDPNLHQAMFEIDNPDVPAGTVLQVMMPGYTLGDRLLRPAMVGVAKGGPEGKVDTKA